MVKAPEFTLQDKDSKKHSLKDIKSDFVIVYFYPRDNTPGCTMEAIMFTKDLAKFKKLNTSIVGISGGDEKSKTKFCEKNKLKVTLLSDPDFKVCKKYKTYGKKKFMGREFMGIKRETFVLDKKHNIIKHYKTVKPTEHSKDLLDFIRSS